MLEAAEERAETTQPQQSIETCTGKGTNCRDATEAQKFDSGTKVICKDKGITSKATNPGGVGGRIHRKETGENEEHIFDCKDILRLAARSLSARRHLRMERDMQARGKGQKISAQKRSSVSFADSVQEVGSGARKQEGKTRNFEGGTEARGSMPSSLPFVREDWRRCEQEEQDVGKRKGVTLRIACTQDSKENRDEETGCCSGQVLGTSQIRQETWWAQQGESVQGNSSTTRKNAEVAPVIVPLVPERRCDVFVQSEGTLVNHTDTHHAHVGRGGDEVFGPNRHWPELSYPLSSGEYGEGDLVLKWVEEQKGNSTDGVTVHELQYNDFCRQKSSDDWLGSSCSCSKDLASFPLSDTSDGVTLNDLQCSNFGRPELSDKPVGLPPSCSNDIHSFPLYVPRREPLRVPRLNLPCMRWLEDVELYDAVMRSIPRNERQAYKNSHMVEFVEVMVHSGIISTADPKEVRNWCKVWPLLEESKRRWRLIVDPTLLNRAVKRNWAKLNLQTKFSSLRRIRANIVKAEVVIAYDFKCFYYQIPLGNNVRKYFGVRIADTTYVLNKLAMGFSGSVAIGNTISKAAAKEALRRCGKDTEIVVQVDNIYFLCAKGDATAIRVAMDEVCREWHITVGSTEQFARGVILGAVYDCDFKTVQLTEKFQHKHRDLLAAFFTAKDYPVIIFWRVAAVLLRSLQVLARPLCFYFQVMRAIRRVAAKLFDGSITWTMKVSLNNAELAQMHEMYQLFLENEPQVCFELPVVTDEVVFSDASEQLLGVVIVKERSIFTWSKALDETEAKLFICELEALALKNAVRLASLVGLQNPTFVVDASALAHAVIRGLSKNVWLNATISSLKGRFANAKILRVASNLNPADAPSRGSSVAMQVLDDALQWVQAEGKYED